MLDIRDLSVSYGAHAALNGVSLNVNFGEIVVILGANGAGKSSLLKAAAGTSEGDVTGVVTLDGAGVSGVSADRIVEMGIAFVPEGRGIFGDLTVGENLTLGAYSNHARKSQKQNLSQVYDLFPKLRERNSQISRTMSGGEQQMVAIGRAMMSDPKILMLDEPSLGLSPLLCKELFANLTKVRDTGIGVLMVEQNAKQSLAIADRGYLIENGSITGENDAAGMLNDPAVQAAYLGGAGASNSSASAGLPRKGGHSVPYLKPSTGGLPQRVNLASDAIQSLVSRAEETDRRTYQSAVELGYPVDAGNKIKPVRHVVAGPKPKTPALEEDSVQDDPLKAMVESMEKAAAAAAGASARIGHSNNRASGKQDSTHSNLSDDRPEQLPTIPVYRKTGVEIYRRGPGGDLQKVKR